MKTAITIPDRVFKQAQRHARRVGKSNDQLVTDAVSEYLVRHGPNSGVNSSGRKIPKARFSKSQLLRMAKNNPAPKSWFQEPEVDLTKPSGS